MVRINGRRRRYILFYGSVQVGIEKFIIFIKTLKKIFHAIILTFNIIAAISLALACLCGFINPKTIWWIGFFGLAYVYLLVINICFAAFWAFSSKKIFALISFVTILAGWNFVGKHIQIFEKAIPEEKLDDSFKIVSFNVQGFLQMNSRQPNGEMLNIFDFFNEIDADIICMQEFVTDRRRNTDAQSLRRYLGNMPYSHSELPGGYFGVATFSKYPIIRRELIYSDRTTNACISTDIVIENDTVRVYNVHLKSVAFNNDEKHLLNNVVKKEYDRADIRTIISILRNLKNSSLQREKQVELLMAHIAQSPYPVVICGDFNDPPASHTYRILRGNRKDAFVEAGSGRSTTYDIGKIASLRIDYIMYSDYFRAYDYKSPRVHISDHFPVLCRLVRQQ